MVFLAIREFCVPLFFTITPLCKSRDYCVPYKDMSEEKTTQNISEKICQGDKAAFDMLVSHILCKTGCFCSKLSFKRNRGRNSVRNLRESLDEKEIICNIKNLKSYLYISTKNRCLNHIRNHSKFTTLEENLPTLQSDDTRLTAMEQGELHARLADAVAQLPKNKESFST